MSSPPIPPAVRIGRFVRYRPTDVAAWVETLTDRDQPTYQLR